MSFLKSITRRSANLLKTQQAIRTGVVSERPFNWEDPLDIDGLLSEEEKMFRDTFNAYCQDKLAPRIVMSNRHEKNIVRQVLGDLTHKNMRGNTRLNAADIEDHSFIEIYRISLIL